MEARNASLISLKITYNPEMKYSVGLFWGGGICIPLEKDIPTQHKAEKRLAAWKKLALCAPQNKMVQDKRFEILRLVWLGLKDQGIPF